jgi:hypothetical protein
MSAAVMRAAGLEDAVVALASASAVASVVVVAAAAPLVLFALPGFETSSAAGKIRKGKPMFHI